MINLPSAVAVAWEALLEGELILEKEVAERDENSLGSIQRVKKVGDEKEEEVEWRTGEVLVLVTLVCLSCWLRGRVRVRKERVWGVAEEVVGV